MKSLHSAAVEIQFTNDDYRAIESSGVIPVVVTKNQRIATPLTISINPLTVAQANSEGVPLEGIPPDNPFVPPYAGKFKVTKPISYLLSCSPSFSKPLHLAGVADFDSAPVIITFLPDEDSSGVVDIPSPVVIVDDVINEATEQVFVVQLELISSVNPHSVDLTLRSASLCRIIDNDGK